jgi:hypothetical protein
MRGQGTHTNAGTNPRVLPTLLSSRLRSFFLHERQHTKRARLPNKRLKKLAKRKEQAKAKKKKRNK